MALPAFVPLKATSKSRAGTGAASAGRFCKRSNARRLSSLGARLVNSEGSIDVQLPATKLNDL